MTPWACAWFSLAGGLRQFRWRIGGGSYESASDSRLHIGIGAAVVIDRLEVFWPSGSIQRFTNLAVDRRRLAARRRGSTLSNTRFNSLSERLNPGTPTTTSLRDV